MARAREARRRLPAGAEMRRRSRCRSPTSRRPAMAPCGTGRRASTASRSWRRATRPSCAASACPAIPTTRHSRYIEAEVERPRSSARSICPTAIRSGPRSSTTSSAGWSGSARTPRELLADERPAVLCRRLERRARGPRRLLGRARPQNDAVMQPEARAAWRRIVHQGWTDALRALPSRRGEALHLLGLYRRLLAARPRLPARPSAVLARGRRPAAGRGRRQMGAGAGEGSATTRRLGWRALHD